MFYSHIETRQARIALCDTQGTGFPVVFLHGNSNAKHVFVRQMESPLAEHHRLIALDLPGHGGSDNARDPRTAYTVSGFADTVSEVLYALGLSHAVLVGWSLGGHIGIELLARDPRVSGLMIIGTPPMARGIFGMLRGFHSHLDLTLTARGRLGPRDIERFARLCFENEAPEELYQTISRADWRMRRVIGRDMIMGTGADQKKIVEQIDKPLAVVNGINEPFARLDYLETLDYAHLWDGHCHVIADTGHAPFFDAPQIFNPLLARFAADVARYAAQAQTTTPRRYA